VRELVAGHPTLQLVAEALLAARAALGEQLSKLQKRVLSPAREDRRVRRLMSAPGVGPIVALTFVAAIDDPVRFRSSKTVGAHFGLTPKKYQSGGTDRPDLEDRRRQCLAVVLHRMLANDTEFVADKAAAAA
jgi:transposase